MDSWVHPRCRVTLWLPWKVIEKEHNTCDWNNRGARVTFRDPAVSLYFHHFARAVYKDEETILVTHRLADNLTAFHSSLVESTLNTKTPQMVYGEHFQIVSFLKVLTKWNSWVIKSNNAEWMLKLTKCKKKWSICSLQLEISSFLIVLF